MTSSIYPLIPSLTATTIVSGSGYTTIPTVTFDPPLSGTTATGTANIANGVIDTISGLSGGSGYIVGEEVILSGGTGTGALAVANIGGPDAVQSIAFFSNRGSGFTVSDSITITGVTSGANTASFTVVSIANNAVSSITLTNGGSGYTSAPSITISGGGGSGAGGTGVFAIRSTIANDIPTNSNILTSDIEITSEMVSPGRGGILRLYFSFVFSSTPGSISVFNNDILKGNLNSDNSQNLVDDGYYRFDIDVEAGDNINLQSSTDPISSVNFFRAHLVQFGA